MPLSNTDLRPFLFTLVLGFVAAQVCVWINTPLPWMIGPLFATAAARLCGANLSCPVSVREAGQWAIGTTLGLYFTPAVLVILISYIGFIAAGVAFAVVLGAGCGWLLHRLSGVDKTTAFFAMAVGGASEMANQGERVGAQVDRVAAAHGLRIMLVVAIVPFALKFSGVHGVDHFVPAIRTVDYVGLSLLVLLTSIGAFGLKQLKSPNAWVIGPLLVAAGLSAFGANLSALPEWVIQLGQLFIGVSLGTRFAPEFLHTAPRYLASVAVCNVAGIALAALFGGALAYASGIHIATAILATAPGGIAEMSLTAKTLQLGVPIVTTFHVMRMVVLVVTIGPMFRLVRHLNTAMTRA
jgi:membrane AbrB-like protein